MPPQGRQHHPAVQQRRLPHPALGGRRDGAYANLTFVSHTETEFVFDFVYVLPHEPRGVVRSRVIASPKPTSTCSGMTAVSSLAVNVARMPP